MATYHSRNGVTSRLRKRGHDYSSASSYFVTLCTEKGLPLLGEVANGTISLSPAGTMVDSWWNFMPAGWPDVIVDAMIVMPNHLHAVMHIGTDPDVSTSLGDVVRWFKVRTTYDYTLGVRDEGWPRFPKRLWQERYYDHIIRSDSALAKTRLYIEGNPWKWADDEYNTRE